MELKDMILSTLAELEDVSEEVVEQKQTLQPFVEEVKEKKEEPNEVEEIIEEETSTCKSVLEDEKHFCESMRERILVLFEGFQSPNNKSIEAKVDLTLNFLEYSLAVLDERLEKLDKK
jgi:hypothetical protein